MDLLALKRKPWINVQLSGTASEMTIHLAQLTKGKCIEFDTDDTVTTCALKVKTISFASPISILLIETFLYNTKTKPRQRMLSSHFHGFQA